MILKILINKNCMVVRSFRHVLPKSALEVGMIIVSTYKKEKHRESKDMQLVHDKDGIFNVTCSRALAINHCAILSLNIQNTLWP